MVIVGPREKIWWRMSKLMVATCIDFYCLAALKLKDMAFILIRLLNIWAKMRTNIQSSCDFGIEPDLTINGLQLGVGINPAKLM